MTQTNNTVPAEKVRANAVVQVRKMDGKLEFLVKGVSTPIVFDPDKCSAEVRARAMIHGFTQRISDGAALSRDTATGLPATPEAKHARMKALADHYMSGTTEWALRVAAPRPAAFDPDFAVEVIIRAGLNGARGREDVDALCALTVKSGRAADREGALRFWCATDKGRTAADALRAERAPAAPAEDLLAEILAAAAAGTGDGEREEAPF